MRRSVASRNTETRTGTFNNRFLTNKRQRELAQSSPRERHTRDTIIGMNTQHVRESSAQACNSSETRPSPTPHPGYLTPPYGEAPPGIPTTPVSSIHTPSFQQSALMPSHISCRCISLERVVHVSGCISYLYLVVSGLYLVISLYLVFSLCLVASRAFVLCSDRGS